jgi:(2Fe-2S) ferredoxin
MKARAKELGLQRVRVNMAGCLDRCELGPCVVIYPEGIWYRVRSREDVDAVLARHVQEGGRVPELLLAPE